MQSERLWRDAANPKLHALGLDLNEGGVRSVLLARKIHIIGGLPAPAYLRRAFAQRCRPDQCNVGVVGVVLKDGRHLASAPDFGRLSRSAIGEECEEPDRPVVLVGTPHWPRSGAAVLGRGRKPAIARACDGLGRAGEQPAHFDLIALVFRSGHRKASNQQHYGRGSWHILTLKSRPRSLKKWGDRASTVQAFSLRPTRWLANGVPPP